MTTEIDHPTQDCEHHMTNDFPIPRSTSRTTRWLAPIALVLLLGTADACARSESATGTTDLATLLSDDPSQQLALYQQYQDDVATCMKELGFDYLPYAPSDPQTPASRMPPDEFRRTYGYGIIAHYTQPELFDYDAPVDPNQQAMQAMDETTRNAFVTALEGPGAPTQEVSPDPTKVGCKQAATARRQGVDVTAASRTLADALDASDAQIKASPEMLDAWRKWSTCMSGQGMEFTDVDSIASHIQQLAIEAYPELTTGTTPEQLLSDPVKGPSARARAAELQSTEADIAVADHDCQERFVTSTLRDLRSKADTRIAASNQHLVELVKSSKKATPTQSPAANGASS